MAVKWFSVGNPHLWVIFSACNIIFYKWLKSGCYDCWSIIKICCQNQAFCSCLLISGRFYLLYCQS